MSDKGKFSGHIVAYYVALSGFRIEVHLSFDNIDQFTETVTNIAGSRKWEINTPLPTPPIAAIPTSRSGGGPYSCPKHGDQKILKNKKGGKHSHYCAVKDEGEWCGEKIYR